MSALPIPTLCDLYALQPHLPLHVFLLTCRECSLSDLFVCARMYAGWLTAVAFCSCTRLFRSSSSLLYVVFSRESEE